MVSPGQILLTIAVAPDAAPGARSLVVANPDDGPCSSVTYNSALLIIDPPHVTAVKKTKMNGKFALKIQGTNFHPSVQVYIGSEVTSWPYVTYKNTSTLPVKKVQSLFPKGVEVTLRIVNPDDGGETTVTFTR